MSSTLHEVTGNALAGPTVAISLAQIMLDKNIISLSEYRSMIEGAMKVLAPFTPTAYGPAAQNLLIGLLQSHPMPRS